jgi:hypothetical protein
LALLPARRPKPPAALRQAIGKQAAGFWSGSTPRSIDRAANNFGLDCSCIFQADIDLEDAAESRARINIHMDGWV